MKRTALNLGMHGIAVWLLIAVGGCVQQDLGIGATVTDCCDTDYSRFATFELSVDALPQFLRSTVETELTNALEGRGLTRVDTMGDLVVDLRMLQQNLDEPLARDPFQGRLDPGGEIRFLADLQIQMVDRTSGDLVWRGVVSRIHDVVPGETMPLERAQAAIGEAFRHVLRSYPERVE